MSLEPEISRMIPVFLEEVGERLGVLEREINCLRAGADPKPLVKRIAAELHTIKGSASSLSLFNLAEAAHGAEAIIASCRARDTPPDRAMLEALRAAVRAIRELSESLAVGVAPAGGSGSPGPATPLRDILRHLAALARARASVQGRGVEIDVRVEGDPMLERDHARLLWPALLHTLNNCVDHASEPPAVRLRARKPALTAITVEAALVPCVGLRIAVCDDGPGLDRASIARRAASLGLIPFEDPARLDDATLEDLILGGGVSTAEAPSIRAGRGIGLEAVRLAITDLGGSVRVLSSPGRGTTVTFLIPVLNRPSGNTDTGSESANAA